MTRRIACPADTQPVFMTSTLRRTSTGPGRTANAVTPAPGAGFSFGGAYLIWLAGLVILYPA